MPMASSELQGDRRPLARRAIAQNRLIIRICPGKRLLDESECVFEPAGLDTLCPADKGRLKLLRIVNHDGYPS